MIELFFLSGQSNATRKIFFRTCAIKAWSMAASIKSKCSAGHKSKQFRPNRKENKWMPWFIVSCNTNSVFVTYHREWKLNYCWRTEERLQWEPSFPFSAKKSITWKANVNQDFYPFSLLFSKKFKIQYFKESLKLAGKLAMVNV